MLSNRELEVFRRLGAGDGTREIADRLGVSLKTVQTYCARIKEKLGLPQVGLLEVRNYLVTVFEKLDVKTRAQAASLYSRQMARSTWDRTPPRAVGAPSELIAPDEPAPGAANRRRDHPRMAAG